MIFFACTEGSMRVEMLRRPSVIELTTGLNGTDFVVGCIWILYVSTEGIMDFSQSFW